MSNTYCSSCKIEVQNGDTLRDHYKGEFHRYNIKRKIVGLPPVTTDQFAQKKSQLLAESSQSERDQLIKCELCSKTFASKGTYKQHLESNKHKENLKKFNRNERSPVKGENKEQEDKSCTTAQDQTVCLFCNKKSADVDENLVHMRLSHSFFISDLRNLKDLKGLLRYLGNKVHRRGLCIYCGIGNSRETRSGEAVQRHMIDKGHIFMNTEDFGEYERFYDFSKAMEEFRRNNLTVEKDDVIMEEDEYMEIEIGNDEEERSSEEDDWEVIEKEGEKVYRLRTAKVLDSGEIQLPNGNILGHRKYKNAYKQYYRDLVRQSSLETSAIDYQDEKSLAARQEENRLAQVNQDLMRREKTAVESQTHKMVHRKEREALKQGLRANNALHFRKQQN